MKCIYINRSMNIIKPTSSNYKSKALSLLTCHQKDMKTGLFSVQIKC